MYFINFMRYNSCAVNRSYLKVLFDKSDLCLHQNQDHPPQISLCPMYSSLPFLHLTPPPTPSPGSHLFSFYLLDYFVLSNILLHEIKRYTYILFFFILLSILILGFIHEVVCSLYFCVVFHDVGYNTTWIIHSCIDGQLCCMQFWNYKHKYATNMWVWVLKMDICTWVDI